MCTFQYNEITKADKLIEKLQFGNFGTLIYLTVTLVKNKSGRLLVYKDTFSFIIIVSY